MQFSPYVFRVTLQLLVLLTPLLALAPASGASCTHYASPIGGGNGLSPSSPFKISSFWSVASPGSTLCLLDGTYADSSSMIMPPSGLRGTSIGPITVKALNDGRVLINGQGVRLPLQLNDNDWFVIEGINVANSSFSVVNLKNGAENNIIRRVIAWNANASQSTVWAINSAHNTLEDVAGFGTGRKIFSNSQGGDFTIIRRAWGMWEKSTQIGPKSVYDTVYNSYDSIYENVIGTWDETAMDGASIDQPKGIFSTVGPTPSATQDYCTRSKFLGSIGYVTAAAKANSWLAGLFGSRSVDCFEFRHVVMYIQGHTNLRAVLAQKFDGGPPSTGALNAPFGDRRLVNVTEIGGTSSSISTDPINGWTITNHLDSSAVPTGTTNIWNGSSSSGARVCKRYKNGVLTNEPLWPWPMNQRIIDAMIAAGKSPIDLTETIESMFGAIPAECKTGDSAPAVTLIPFAPTNLRLVP